MLKERFHLHDDEIMEIDDNESDAGAPLFLPEHRTEKNFAVLDEMHSAILDYAHQMQGIDWAAVDISLPDCIFGLLSDKSSKIRISYFSEEELLDEFCRRRFSL